MLSFELKTKSQIFFEPVEEFCAWHCSSSHIGRKDPACSSGAILTSPWTEDMLGVWNAALTVTWPLQSGHVGSFGPENPCSGAPWAVVLGSQALGSSKSQLPVCGEMGGPLALGCPIRCGLTCFQSVPGLGWGHRMGKVMS